MADAEAGGEATLGQMLRTRREARGISREEAAALAGLQLVFLRALEEDDYRLLPDEMYLSRFVFEYAVFLNLDPALADAAFHRQFRRAATPAPPHGAAPRLGALRWRQLLLGAGIILPLVPLGFILASLLGHEPAPAPPAPAPAAPAPAPERPEPRDGPPGGNDAASAQPPHGSGPEGARAAPPGSGTGPQEAAGHNLVVRAHEVTWLAVRTDSDVPHEVLLREGEMARWRARQGFSVTIGNAGGVELLLDGLPVPIPAQRGEVIRDLRLPPGEPSR